MKDLLENENGMLDQGYFSPEQIEMRNIASGLTQRPPMVPTSPLEDRLMRRTMNAVPAANGCALPRGGCVSPWRSRVSLIRKPSAGAKKPKTKRTGGADAIPAGRAVQKT